VGNNFGVGVFEFGAPSGGSEAQMQLERASSAENDGRRKPQLRHQRLALPAGRSNFKRTYQDPKVSALAGTPIYVECPGPA
jgi:hypothetical protein